MYSNRRSEFLKQDVHIHVLQIYNFKYILENSLSVNEENILCLQNHKIQPEKIISMKQRIICFKTFQEHFRKFLRKAVKGENNITCKRCFEDLRNMVSSCIQYRHL